MGASSHSAVAIGALPEGNDGKAVVDKSKRKPPPAHTFFVAELAVSRAGPETLVELVCSVPGREGTLCYRWAAPNGVVDSGTATDLQARLGSLVFEALATFLAVQEVLPL